MPGLEEPSRTEDQVITEQQYRDMTEGAGAVCGVGRTLAACVADVKPTGQAG
jgi:hypothetical protein